jgi:hypothetical protein
MGITTTPKLPLVGRISTIISSWVYKKGNGWLDCEPAVSD